MTQATYRPGYCNIGRRERTRRYGMAGIGFVAAVGYLLAIAALGAFDQLLVGVFVPLALAYEWLVQAHVGFCAALALGRRYDFSGSGGGRGVVTDPDDWRSDRSYAARVTLLGVGAAAVTTALLYGLGTFLA